MDQERFRPIEKAKKALSLALEDIARGIKRKLRFERLDSRVESAVEREIGLVLDHIDGLRAHHQGQLSSILRSEAYINTELMHLEMRMPKYYWVRFPEKEKLQRRLQDLGKERRSIQSKYQEKLQSLEDKLLDLLHRHVQLDQKNGD